MNRSSVLALAALAAVLGCAGCSHIPFIGKKKPEKQSRHIATDTEKEFEDRWMDKRASELVAQGQSPESARDQAQKEFYQKFPATFVAQQATGQVER